MPTKQEVLIVLAPMTCSPASNNTALEVRDRRVKEGLVDALSRPRKAHLEPQPLFRALTWSFE